MFVLRVSVCVCVNLLFNVFIFECFLDLFLNTFLKSVLWYSVICK